MIFTKQILLIASLFIVGMSNPIEHAYLDSKLFTHTKVVTWQAEEIIEKVIPLEYPIEEEKPRELTPFEKSQKIDLSLQPNEAGQVMVLMYHTLGETEGFCRRSITNFKNDLKLFYEEGYVPIRLSDYVANQIDIPEGKTPIVLTFDDGNITNFQLIEKDGKWIIDENSVIGIMENFKKEYPEYPMTATFFLYGENPFMQKEHIAKKLNFLVQNGYDIGNHTYRHASFSHFKSKEAIEKALGKEIQFLSSQLKEKYTMDTLAVPYGNRPLNKDLEPFLIQGVYEDTKYKHVAIVNVGWDPNPSPITKGFDPYNIHRVTGGSYQVGTVGIDGWMEFFRRNRQDEKRPLYISDGEPDVITVPKKYAAFLDYNKIPPDEYVYLYE